MNTTLEAADAAPETAADDHAWLDLEPEPPARIPRWSSLRGGLLLLFWAFFRTDRLWRATAAVERHDRPHAWSYRFIVLTVPIITLGWLAIVAGLHAWGLDPARLDIIGYRLGIYALLAALILPAMGLAPILRWPVGIVAALAATVVFLAPLGALAPPELQYGPQAILPLMMTMTWGIRLGPAGALRVGLLMAILGGAVLGIADGPAFGWFVAIAVTLVALRIPQLLVELATARRHPQIFDADGVLPMPRAAARVAAELATGRPGPLTIALARNPLRRPQLHHALAAHLAAAPDPAATRAAWDADPRLSAPASIRPSLAGDRADRPSLRDIWRDLLPQAPSTPAPTDPDRPSAD